MAKTTEQLLQQAVQIRDEQANKKNTALRVGTLFSDIIEKQEESDQTHATDVTKINEAVTENRVKVAELEGLFTIFGINVKDLSEINPNKNTGSFINNAGKLISFASCYITDSIAIPANTIIMVSGNLQSTVSAVSSFKNGTYTPLAVGSDSVDTFYDGILLILISEATDIVFSGFNVNPLKIYTAPLGQGYIKDIDKKIESLNASLTGFDNELHGYSTTLDKLGNKIIDIKNNKPDVNEISGEYISKNLQITKLKSYKRTEKISLKKGEQIILEGRVDTIVSAITKCDDNGTPTEVLEVGTGEKSDIYSYMAPEDCFVILSFAQGFSFNYIIKYQQIISEIKDEASKTSKDVERIDETLSGKKNAINPTSTSGYFVGINDNILKVAAYSISEPIRLNKGQKIQATLAAQNTVSAISVTEKSSDIEGRFHKTTIIGVNNDLLPSEYSYTATENCYVEFSFLGRENLSNVVITNVPLVDKVENMSNDIEKLENIVDNIVKAFVNNNYYAINRLFCLGDSLTSGAYYGSNFAGKSINENYPNTVGRMLGIVVENGGYSGYSASTWYTENMEKYDFSKYDSFVIWLGTNNGLTDTLETDVNPYDNYDDFALTETGYYCKIIEYIKSKNSSCVMFLGRIFASKDDVEVTNTVIDKIAQKYNLATIDFSDMGHIEHPEWHCGIANPHFGKAGNIEIAKRVVDKLNSYFSEDLLRCEFGVTERVLE